MADSTKNITEILNFRAGLKNFSNNMSDDELRKFFNPSTTHPDVPKGLSQKDRLLAVLQDGEWHDTVSIQRDVYGADHLGNVRTAARAKDLKNEGHMIESKKLSKTIWAYRLLKS
jgi:hypothetical protein